ncbi:MAG: ATP-binding protein, partial [Treponema sp.]|nr:ATP-binding protein [Treponema sp.]MCL2236869.1 ATP-binding protein [Treponema sp.]
SDTGIGIADHEMDHIFAGYDQIDAVEKFRKGGSGLGLHISKKLVDLMKGTLALNSELGKGSVFTLTVPQKVLADTVIDSETRNRLMSFSYIVK